jgi:hypothetical protein
LDPPRCSKSNLTAKGARLMQTSQQIDALIDAQLERDIRAETEWTDEESHDDQDGETTSTVTPTADRRVFPADEFKGVFKPPANSG